MIQAISRLPDDDRARSSRSPTRSRRTRCKIDEIVDGLLDSNATKSSTADGARGRRATRTMTRTRTRTRTARRRAATNLERLKVGGARALRRDPHALRQDAARSLAEGRPQARRSTSRRAEADLRRADEIRFSAQQVEKLCDSVRSAGRRSAPRTSARSMDLVRQQGAACRAPTSSRSSRATRHLRWVDREIDRAQSVQRAARALSRRRSWSSSRS